MTKVVDLRINPRSSKGLSFAIGEAWLVEQLFNSRNRWFVVSYCASQVCIEKGAERAEYPES